MAISLDGYICGPNNETPWSEAEWDNYHEYISNSDCLIIGRNTYEAMTGADEFARLGNPNTIVISSTGTQAKTPENALEIAANNKWDKIIIGGGQILNTYFLKNKLATHLHLDIEPITLNSGTNLFEKSNGFNKFEYNKSEILPSGTISVDYKIIL